MESRFEAGMKRERILKMSDFENLKNTALKRICEDWILCTEPYELERAKTLLSPLVRIFHKEISENPLPLIYIYRQSEQLSKNQKSDGNLYRETNKSGNLIYCCLGISTEALQQGKEYTALVFMHELTHINFPEHDKNFHEYLNNFISLYKIITGSTVKNDYYGLSKKEKLLMK